MSCKTIQERVSGNLYIRENKGLKKDEVILGHKHNFDHTTIVFKGSIRVVTPDRTAEFVAPADFLVKKDVEHEITALEDDTTFWCVYSHRDENGNVVNEANGNIDAYGTAD